MVVADGLEPSTPALSRRCSNQLSYATIRVSGGAGRSRTDDILLAKQALYQLSYGPGTGPGRRRSGMPAGPDPCRCYQMPGKERKVNSVLGKFIFCGLKRLLVSVVPLARLRTIYSLRISSYLYFSYRKEVIQPQVPLRLPCYDFVPITTHSLGPCPLAVGSDTSGLSGFHDVTGGVYKARERIHGSVADLPLLAIPAS